MFKLALFDLDNTLYSDIIECECYQAVCDFLQTKKIHVSIHDCMTAKQKAKYKYPSTLNRLCYFKELVGSNKLDIALSCYELYWSVFYLKIKPFDGLIDLLDCFKQNKIKIKLCSNFTLEHQIKKCISLQVLDYFDDMVTSEEITIRKPNKQIFDSACNMIPSSQTMMIGDNKETDIKGGINNGCFCFYFDPKQINSFIVQDYNNKIIISFNHYSFIVDFFQLYFHHLSILSNISKRIGERYDLTQSAGGNCSIKFSYNEYNFLIIKSSGMLLADVSFFEGHSLLLLKNSEFTLLWGGKPSIETCVHLTLTKQIVIHCHPISLIKEISKTSFQKISSNYHFVSYISPGLELSTVLQSFKDTNLPIYLQNHGLIMQFEISTSIQTICNSINNSIFISNQIEDNMLLNYTHCNGISLLLDGITTLFTHSTLFTSLYKSQNEDTFLDLCFTPDYVVFCGGKVYNILNLYDLKNIKTNDNKVIYYNNLIFFNSRSLSICKQMEEIFFLHVNCLQSHIQNKLHFLSKNEVESLNNREDEKYRKTL